MGTYYNHPPSPPQGSGGFVTFDGWQCSSESGGYREETGHDSDCTSLSGHISGDRPPPAPAAPCEPRLLASLLERRLGAENPSTPIPTVLFKVFCFFGYAFGTFSATATAHRGGSADVVWKDVGHRSWEVAGVGSIGSNDLPLLVPWLQEQLIKGVAAAKAVDIHVG
jgi:hypothetical protein